MSNQTSCPQRVSVPPPRALPAAAWLGPLAALVLVALGVVLGQEALSRWDVVGTSWLGVALTASTACAPAPGRSRRRGPGRAGLLVLVVTLKPRRRTHARVDGDADLWVSPSALAALARDAAEGVPGVARVRVSLRPAVRVRAAASPRPLAGPVEEAVTGPLDGAGSGSPCEPPLPPRRSSAVTRILVALDRIAGLVLALVLVASVCPARLAAGRVLDLPVSLTSPPCSTWSSGSGGRSWPR